SAGREGSSRGRAGIACKAALKGPPHQASERFRRKNRYRWSATMTGGAGLSGPRSSESVPETQLPDPHESGLRADAAECRGVDRRRVNPVELRRVRQVENLESNLSRLVPRQPRRLRHDQVDVLPELIARAAISARRVAVLSDARIRERAGVEVLGVQVDRRRDAFVVAAASIGIAAEGWPLAAW